MTAYSSVTARQRGTVRIDILLRAVAILLVALNHAVDAAAGNTWLNGGMSVLMMTSGMSFARLALDDGTPQRAARTLTRFAGKLLLATLSIVLITTPVRETDILIASGFIYTFTELPFWYGAQMGCICLALAGLFAVGPFARGFFRAPLAASLALLAVLVVVHTVCERIWDTHLFEHRLPHLIAWNFVLGWALYFLTRNGTALSWRTPAALLVAGAAAAVGWGAKSDVGYLMAACFAVTFVRAIRLPAAAARAVNIVAQATFFIYLTSWIFVAGFAHAAHRFFPATSVAGTIATVAGTWAGSVLASIALWLVWTATARALQAARKPVRAPAAADLAPSGCSA